MILEQVGIETDACPGGCKFCGFADDQTPLEPNLVGLTSGANAIYAEAGVNPRDAQRDTLGHRGRDVNDCRTMLYEAGFEYLVLPAGRKNVLQS
jgi:hypothetical protein